MRSPTSTASPRKLVKRLALRVLSVRVALLRALRSVLRALVSHAVAQHPDFYLRPCVEQCRASATAMLSEEPRRLVASEGKVVEGDLHLAEAAPMARRFGLSSSWLPDRRPVCSH